MIKLWTVANQFQFFCPGCLRIHSIDRDRWSLAGDDLERPTISPSVVIQIEPTDPSVKPKRCHFFITDGWIDFLPDCTHSKAGCKIELPEILSRESLGGSR